MTLQTTPLLANHGAAQLTLTIFPPIPHETAKAARAIFGRSNFYLITGDYLNRLFEGVNLVDPSGRYSKTPQVIGMQFLLLIFQYIETLPDHLAVDALRGRVDWKYALHLPLTYPELEVSSLCEFRGWLLVEPSGQQNLQQIFLHLSKLPQNTSVFPVDVNATQIISAVCQFSRYAKIRDVINQAMEALALHRPDWLLEVSLPHWYERYSHYNKSFNLKADEHQNSSQAQAIGSDGFYLLEKISASGIPELESLHEIKVLKVVWREQFEWVDAKMVWRKEICAGCSLPGSSHPFHSLNHKEQEVEVD